MKKIIATVSITLSLVFAFALANAADSPSSNQQSGTVDNNNNNSNPDMNSTTTVEKTVTTEHNSIPSDSSVNSNMGGTTSPDMSISKNSKTCTDENGISYHSKQKGFDRCLQAKKNNLSNNQPGNQLGTGGYDSSIPNSSNN